jgi:hypothetical protein
MLPRAIVFKTAKRRTGGAEMKSTTSRVSRLLAYTAELGVSLLEM